MYVFDSEFGSEVRVVSGTMRSLVRVCIWATAVSGRGE